MVNVRGTRALPAGPDLDPTLSTSAAEKITDQPSLGFLSEPVGTSVKVTRQNERFELFLRLRPALMTALTPNEVPEGVTLQA